MYSQIQFKTTILYKNTLYSVLKKDKGIHKKTLEYLTSFFDENDTINYFKYKRNELTNVIIQNNKKYYDDCLFQSCKNLINIKLSDNSKQISKWMFSNCINLKNIELPIGLIRINRYAFCGCKNLEYIELPDTICNIDSLAFAYCPNLKYIKYKGKKYTSPEKFNKDMEKYGLIKYTKSNDYIWSR